MCRLICIVCDPIQASIAWEQFLVGGVIPDNCGRAGTAAPAPEKTMKGKKPQAAQAKQISKKSGRYKPGARANRKDRRLTSNQSEHIQGQNRMLEQQNVELRVRVDVLEQQLRALGVEPVDGALPFQ